MSKTSLKPKDKVVLKQSGLEQVIELLQAKGYTTIGPIIENKVIKYGPVNTVTDFPVGWNDIQEAGYYGLKPSENKAFFEYAVGPNSLKDFLHPPEVRLWRAKHDNKNGFALIKDKTKAPKYAFIGVRPCDLQAAAIQDKIFNNAKYIDPIYNKRRQAGFIVVVNCTRPGGTCFCASMNTGPKAKSGFDLALTEVIGHERHYFLTEIGNKRAANIIAQIPYTEADEAEIAEADNLLEKAAENMGRVLDPCDAFSLRSIFPDKFEHGYWDVIAERCLFCGNCTMVCPTCFCTSVEDANTIDGQYAERWRKWDSCFSKEFSYMHGGSIRFSAKARYRQWLTHKFSTWFDQFGTCGCVGCGRCITWCPVGIDVTESIHSLLAQEKEHQHLIQTIST